MSKRDSQVSNNPYAGDMPQKTYGDELPNLSQIKNQEQVQENEFEPTPKNQQNEDNQVENNIVQQSQKQQEKQQQQQYNSFSYQGNNAYLHHNKRVLEQFLEVFKEDLKQYYTDFAKNSQEKQNEDIEPIVFASDLPLIMRTGFYTDNISFHDGKQDQEEIFIKPNSYKKILAVLKQFLILKKSEVGEEATQDPSKFKIVFNFFLEFVNYFVSSDPDIYLRHNEETDYSGTMQSLHSKKGGGQTLPTQSDLGNEGLLKEIKKSIEKYQQILENTNDVNESQIILGTISALQEQLINLQNADKVPPQVYKTETLIEPSVTNRTRFSNQTSQSRITKEQNRAKNMHFLFLFYCKQQYCAGQGHTFDRILHEQHVLSLGKISLFCKQFKIYNSHEGLTKKSIPQIFKRVTNNLKDMSKEEWKLFLESLALKMFEGKEKQYPTDFHKIDAFYDFINLDDMDKIKIKCKIVTQPFNIKENEGFRLLPQDVGREVKLHQIDTKVLENLKQKKILDKQKMLSSLENTSQNQSFFQSYKNQQKSNSNPYSTGNRNLYAARMSNQSSLGKNYQQKNSAHSFMSNDQNKYKYNYDNYAQRKVKNTETNIKQKQTFSWGELEKFSFEDMKQYQPTSFKPHDLFNDNEDEEDNYYLKEFELDKEKRDKQVKLEKQTFNVENYGNINPNKMRPTQKYLLQNNPSYDPSQRYNPQNIHRHHSQDINQKLMLDLNNISHLSNMNNVSMVKTPKTGFGINKLQQQQLLNNSNSYQQMGQGGGRYTPQNYSVQNRFMSSQQGQNKNLTAQKPMFGSNRNSYQKPQSQLSQSYLKRADQIEGYSRIHQQEQMDRILEQSYVKSGKVSNRY